ncbi:hypothetical protein TNCV_3165881 [Trichonephila clavipes]|uniref:Uncharacterized protein n=1 Tax=Trichonephila clavipes TaxID=2585209 RepID=A0A8X6RDV4_TRICX|nr:hypothetical protein TNCV_3165881 [Trichonephila clavipes]
MWESVRGAKSQARHPTHIVCPRFCHGIHPANGRERREDRRKKRNEREKEEKRARKREGLIVGGRGEENPRVLLGDADQESETRMRKNALRTGRRQAVE